MNEGDRPENAAPENAGPAEPRAPPPIDPEGEKNRREQTYKLSEVLMTLAGAILSWLFLNAKNPEPSCWGGGATDAQCTEYLLVVGARTGAMLLLGGSFAAGIFFRWSAVRVGKVNRSLQLQSAGFAAGSLLLIGLSSSRSGQEQFRLKAALTLRHEVALDGGVKLDLPADAHFALDLGASKAFEVQVAAKAPLQVEASYRGRPVQLKASLDDSKVSLSLAPDAGVLQISNHLSMPPLQISGPSLEAIQKTFLELKSTEFDLARYSAGGVVTGAQR